jgi:hypothetical protein
MHNPFVGPPRRRAMIGPRRYWRIRSHATPRPERVCLVSCFLAEVRRSALSIQSTPSVAIASVGSGDIRQAEGTRPLTIRSDWTWSLQTGCIRRAMTKLWPNINAAKPWRVHCHLSSLLAAAETWHTPKSRPRTMESDWAWSVQSGCIRRAMAKLWPNINAAKPWRVHCHLSSLLAAAEIGYTS